MTLRDGEPISSRSIFVRHWIAGITELETDDLKLVGQRTEPDRATATYRLFQSLDGFATVELVTSQEPPRLRLFLTGRTVDIEVQPGTLIDWS